MDPTADSVAPQSSAGATPRQLAQALRGWRTAGVTHITRPLPLPVTATAAAPVETPPVENIALKPTKPPALPLTETPRQTTPDSPAVWPSVPRAVPCTLSRAERLSQLSDLSQRVAACTRCQELASTRTQTVFGVGNPQARVMFIGEAPGADEDRVGEPFVGKAGQLLNKIITACGWQREELYICNILRCRPPGNRTPAPEEAAHCREYLDGQIAIVDPEYIVCWGSVAAQNLLGSEETIGRLRERWFTHGRAQVLCTYHPSYLLRNPAAKKPVWEDLQRLLKAMGLTPPAG